MKKFLFLVILISIWGVTTAQQAVLIGNVEQGAGADSLSKHRIYTALKLAIEMTPTMQVIPDSSRRAMLEVADSNTTFLSIAKKLKADKVIYASVDIFHGMLRANTIIVDVKTDTEQSGFGYGALHYIKNGEQIYDVALIKALQRSIMYATEDTTLYEHQPKEYRVKPASSLVVGGFIFDNNDAKLIWKLFTNKSVASYFSSESIYQAAKESDNYAVYDLNTRDSMYAAFNLFLMENFTKPTKTEMKILNTFAVEYYIFGNIKRVNEHAEVELFLAKVKDEKLETLRSEKDILKSDDKEKLAKVITNLTNKLLFIEDSKRKTK